MSLGVMIQKAFQIMFFLGLAEAGIYRNMVLDVVILYTVAIVISILHQNHGYPQCFSVAAVVLPIDFEMAPI